MAWGVALGASLVAALDATATTLLPIFGFVPLLYYGIGAAIMGLVAAGLPHRLWRPAALIALLGGILAVGWMQTRAPRWDGHAGWQSCRLIAGPWYARSVAPVAIPECSVLSMCANETRYAMDGLLRAGGCPAP